MNKSMRFLAPLALSLLLSCASDNETQLGRQDVVVDDAYLDEPATLSGNATETLAEGQPITVQFQDKQASLQIGQDASGDPLIALTDDEGTITYFRKSSATLQKANLDEFLQGVWEAFARLKGGVQFALDVDTDNKLTLVIANQEEGIQVDVRVQGTPSEQEVEKAIAVFKDWQDQTSSSSQLSSSTSILSSSSAIKPSSSSSSVAKPVSSSSVNTSSSSAHASSSSSAPISSSSSSGGTIYDYCPFPDVKDFLTTTGTFYPGWTESSFTYKQISCSDGIVQHKTGTMKSVRVKITQSDNMQATVKVYPANSDGGALLDSSPCTSPMGDGSVIPGTTAAYTSFKTCLNNFMQVENLDGYASLF